jgi:hypothetical protein
MCCVIKCIKTKRMLKGNFASSVFHSCNAKTQKTQICVTGPQCVNVILPPTPGCPQWSLSLRFPHQNPVHTSPFTLLQHHTMDTHCCWNLNTSFYN